MSIVDEFTRRVWVYPLKHKHEALGKFKLWLTLQENQTGLKLKYLRTDNGLEFCSKEFDEYCQNKGIARHLTVPGLHNKMVWQRE